MLALHSRAMRSSSLALFLFQITPLVSPAYGQTTIEPASQPCGGRQSRLCPPETYCFNNTCNPYDISGNCTGVCTPMDGFGSSTQSTTLNETATALSTSSPTGRQPPITYTESDTLTTVPSTSSSETTVPPHSSSAPTSPNGQSCGFALNVSCGTNQICQDTHRYGCDPETSPMCIGTCQRRIACNAKGAVGNGNCPPRMLCSADTSSTTNTSSYWDGFCKYRQPRCGGSTDPDCPLNFQCIGTDGTQCNSTDTDSTCTSAKCRLTCDDSGLTPCPEGGACVSVQDGMWQPIPTSSSGICQRATCGGLRGDSCPANFECVDKRGDQCDPKNGGADCIGVCKKIRNRKCGGATGQICSSGSVCVDDPSDSCLSNGGAVECPGTCQLKTPTCGASGDTPCEEGELCITSQRERCDPNDPSTEPCVGQCTKPCGTLTGLQCPAGLKCVDIANAECGIAADCQGVCLKSAAPAIECGGRDGRLCPNGYDCEDTPNDFCDPAKGEFNCPGTCTPTPPSSPATSTTAPTSMTATTPITGPPVTSPEPTTLETSTVCMTTCANYINDCGQSYGGCYDTCTGPAPSFTPPPCSISGSVSSTTESILSTTSL